MKNKIFTIILIIIFISLLLLLNYLLNDKNTKSNENKKEETNVEIINLTSQNFNEQVLQSNQTILIDFYADWCQPCKVLSPTIEEIANENKNIKVTRINIDQENDLATQYEIMSIPTLVVIKNGQETNRVVGVVPKNTILNMINK